MKLMTYRPTRPNKGAATNSRLASPLKGTGQFGGTVCASPCVNAAVADLLFAIMQPGMATRNKRSLCFLVTALLLIAVGVALGSTLSIYFGLFLVAFAVRIAQLHRAVVGLSDGLYQPRFALPR
jgi:hypothetical protein